VLDALVDGAPTHDDVALLVLQVTPLRQQPLRLRLPAVPPSLRFLRRAMNRWLIEAGADAEEAFQITVAVCEGAANVIRHAYGPQEAVFEVEIARDNRDVVATVRDSGRWRPRQVDGGRGITVMRGLMAAVEFDISSTGTTVRMRRALRREAVR
jgi:anti-sigma regulatory factor (Ser/Thr protein kinase)